MAKNTKQEIMQNEHFNSPPRLKEKTKNARMKTIKKKSSKK
jgi:hypothetical protein